MLKKKLKEKIRRNLLEKVKKKKGIYVIDTSVIINKFLPYLLKKGINGKIIIPNAVMAELENLANKGKEEGFIGLGEVINLHKLKNNYNIKISFEGDRPNTHQILFAKSGEIDALIRDLAKKKKATLITADLIQAVSAKAYGINVIFLKVKKEIKKWGKRKRRKRYMR